METHQTIEVDDTIRVINPLHEHFQEEGPVVAVNQPIKIPGLETLFVALGGEVIPLGPDSIRLVEKK